MSIIDCVLNTGGHPVFQYTDDGACEVLSIVGSFWVPTLCSQLNRNDPTEGLWLESSNECKDCEDADPTQIPVRADGSSGKECFVVN